MKTITIYYFHPVDDSKLHYKHNEVRAYSIRERNKIINEILELGFNIQLINTPDSLIIFIDKGRFKQR